MTGPLLHDPISETVAGLPGATAVVMGTERLTYAMLDQMAEHHAALLVQHGCRPGDRVCLLAPKSPATVAAMIGTLRAGCVYVPIDTAGPVARNAQIVASVEPEAVFVLGHGGELLSGLAGAGVVPLDLPAIDLGQSVGAGSASPTAGPRTVVDPSEPAHILFTSGSTGRPKGVVVTHASARAFVDWAVGHFNIRPGERCAGHSPLHFDLSTFDVYATLAAGGELHLVPPGMVLPRQFAEFIAESRLNQLFCVPSAMTYLTANDALPAQGFPSLRRILWCGEVLPTSVLIEWMSRHPAARFTNLYGPTEATIASSYHPVDDIPDDASRPVPIGTACGGEELLLLDEAGSLLGEGLVGELCIAGVGLSPGYWQDPEATAKVFIEDPRPDSAGGRIYRTGDLARRDLDGVYHFVGRRDTQIKHRGYRIELGEIEAAVSALPAVGECAVLAVGTEGFEGTVICCAVVSSAGCPDLTPPQLRAALSERVPRYMLPARWRLMDALPKNVNGKTDRRELREHFESEVAAS